MNTFKAFASGLVGSVTLTLLHETLRHNYALAPRMDVLGMRAIQKLADSANATPPAGNRLFNLTMAGDLLGNALYYMPVSSGSRKGIWERGVALGLTAGVGALALPGPLGLGSKPSNRSLATQALTLGLYIVGGLAAASTAYALSNSKE